METTKTMKKRKAAKEKHREPARSLDEFFGAFVRRHAVGRPVPGFPSGEVALNISPQECEQLGRWFIGIMAGWAAGLDLEREKQRLTTGGAGQLRVAAPAELFRDEG
jgi:hypothetical protein